MLEEDLSLASGTSEKKLQGLSDLSSLPLEVQIYLGNLIIFARENRIGVLRLAIEVLKLKGRIEKDYESKEAELQSLNRDLERVREELDSIKDGFTALGRTKIPPAQPE